MTGDTAALELLRRRRGTAPRSASSARGHDLTAAGEVRVLGVLEHPAVP